MSRGAVCSGVVHGRIVAGFIGAPYEYSHNP
jgi:hypothetical protein